MTFEWLRQLSRDSHAFSLSLTIPFCFVSLPNCDKKILNVVCSNYYPWCLLRTFCFSFCMTWHEQTFSSQQPVCVLIRDRKLTKPIYIFYILFQLAHEIWDITYGICAASSYIYFVTVSTFQRTQTQYVGALSEIQPTQREEITFDYYLILSHIVYSVVSPIITYNTAFVTPSCHQYPVLIFMTTTSSCHWEDILCPKQ